MKSYTEFNVNDLVRVKLTPRGKQIHRAAYDKMMGPFTAKPPFEYSPPKEDADGWHEIQLWDLMSQYGEYIRNGCIVPFETTIQIENK